MKLIVKNVKRRKNRIQWHNKSEKGCHNRTLEIKLKTLLDHPYKVKHSNKNTFKSLFRILIYSMETSLHSNSDNHSVKLKRLTAIFKGKVKRKHSSKSDTLHKCMLTSKIHASSFIYYVKWEKVGPVLLVVIHFKCYNAA